ncbi:family 20 glycosylhydrolase [Reichenbachiella sp. MALMAid0571]|uniref:beta-N-acetylhexosaminidase n=1 Tax=Reichenbachiella sp. MALMAid0571 TaxID=3143939 RepID=UPI0032DE3AF9
MLKKWIPLVSIVLIACQSQPKIENIEEVAIIPQPTSLTLGDGYFVINDKTELLLLGEVSEISPVVRYFNSVLEGSSGFALSVDNTTENEIQENSILLELKAGNKKSEAYTLNVTDKGIAIKAESASGLFYGIQSLKQLMPTQLSAGTVQKDIPVVIPAVSIIDEPRFGWRGYMLDVSRHFFGVEDVKRVLDFMAEMKLNRFHWHLADDQGWRIEIKNYPKLTSVGAWRMDYNVTDESISNWWGRPVQQPGETPTYGGFYTQKEIKEIVAYAKALFIEVVPEIDMPGHSQATIAAYPEISCTGGPFYVATGGVYKDNTYCPGKEVTFKFVRDVLGEVMDLFPFNYIHIGGDECNKLSWKKDPDCQRRIKDEGLLDEHELQSYFIKRVEDIVNARGKDMIGWDEILEGGLAPNATVMSWRGEKGGIAAARAGHDVIMTPNKYCYLDLKQGHDDLEPNLGYSYSFLKDAYEYKIISDSLTQEQGRHVLGVQGNLWTESIGDWGKLTYMTFPRLYAIAENGWTAEKSKNWMGFTRRLLPQFRRLDAEGERYATSAFNVWIEHEGNNGGIDISMKTEVEGLDIYYTLDGSIPTMNSNKYESTFPIDKTTVIKATTFLDGVQIGNISEMSFPVHKAYGAQVVYNSPTSKQKSTAGVSALVDLNYAKLNAGDPAWQGINGDVELDVVFDTLTEIEKFKMTTLRMTISGIYLPENVEVYGSKDGKSFTKLGETEQILASHTQGRNKVTTEVSFPKTIVKAMRIKAKSVNPIPEGHHRAGSASRISIDELVVY